MPDELTASDPERVAPAAGLVFVPDSKPGIGRRSDDGSFVYVDAFGSSVSPTVRARAEALAIPPAWSDVWICPDPAGYLQATGVDEAGRKQYRYHDRYRAFCETQKFGRLRYFGRALPAVRRSVRAGLDGEPGSKGRAVAAAVKTIDEFLLRVGNDSSANHGHYGATTLTVDHVVDDEFVSLEYVGKSGQEREILIDDDELSALLVELADGADDELFWFDGQGQSARVTASDINEFIRNVAGDAFSAKDFRTWGASSEALRARAEGAGPIAAVDAAADELGNTRTVARNSYVHPRVLDVDDERVSAVWRSSRSSKWRDRSESALLKLLNEAVPPQVP